MNKDRLSRHYNLDLDSLFASGRPTANRSGVKYSLDNPQSKTQDTLSMSWPTPTAAQANSRPSIPAGNSPLPESVGLPPPLTAQTLASEPSQPITRTGSNSTFDVKDFFGDFLSTTPSSLAHIPIPSGLAPSLPAPPVPARNASTSAKKTTYQIKQVRIPNSDLLDLGDVIKAPEVKVLSPVYCSNTNKTAWCVRVCHFI